MPSSKSDLFPTLVNDIPFISLLTASLSLFLLFFTDFQLHFTFQCPKGIANVTLWDSKWKKGREIFSMKNPIFSSYSFRTKFGFKGDFWKEFGILYLSTFRHPFWILFGPHPVHFIPPESTLKWFSISIEFSFLFFFYVLFFCFLLKKIQSTFCSVSHSSFDWLPASLSLHYSGFQ